MNRLDSLPEHLCTDEACDYLGITQRTLWKYVKFNGLPKHKPKGGRPFYLKSELAEWVKKQGNEN